MTTSRPGRKPAPSARVQQKRERSRQEILAVGRGLLLANGVESLTLAALSAELGLTKQALYHYFPSKEALLGALVTSLLNEEIDGVLTAIDKTPRNAGILGTLIRAFYRHYIHQLPAFRAVYCQIQIMPLSQMGMDEKTISEKVNPETRHLFDEIEKRLCVPGTKPAQRRQLRRLAFSAWLSALGLITMLSITDAANDPLVHSDADLLDTLAQTFDTAVLKVV